MFGLLDGGFNGLSHGYLEGSRLDDGSAKVVVGRVSKRLETEVSLRYSCCCKIIMMNMISWIFHQHTFTQ